MDAARHQEVARAFGRRGGEDRRLEFGEAALDHAAADAGDHLRAQHDVGVQPLAPEIEEAIAKSNILGIVAFAEHRQRQFLRGGLDCHFLRVDFHSAGRQRLVDRALATREHLARNGDDRFDADRLGGAECGAVAVENDLGDAVMVAQIDEQHAAMIALAMHPAGQADLAAHVGGAQLGAGVRTIGVHGGHSMW